MRFYKFRLKNLCKVQFSSFDFLYNYNNLFTTSFRENTCRNSLVVIPIIKSRQQLKSLSLNRKQQNANDFIKGPELNELHSLIDSIDGWKICGHISFNYRKDSPLSKTLFTRGIFERFVNEVNQYLDKDDKIDSIVFNWKQLSSLQLYYLYKEFKLPIYDRYSLVVEIFKQRVSQDTNKVYVDLAEIASIKSRLEVDLIDSRAKRRQNDVELCENLIKTVAQVEETQMKKLISRKPGDVKRKNIFSNANKQVDIPKVSIIGYTNSGKTSLVKCLSKSPDATPSNCLFATLTLAKYHGKLVSFDEESYKGPGIEISLIDTVGFMSDLPTSLFPCFKVTFEESLNSTLIIHVIDVTMENWSQKAAYVDRLVNEYQKSLLRNKDYARGRPQIIRVVNKIDLLGDKLEGILEENPNISLGISCKSGENIESLLDIIKRHLLDCCQWKIETILIELSESLLIGWLYRNAAVIEIKEVPDENEKLAFTIGFRPGVYEKFLHEFQKKIFVKIKALLDNNVFLGISVYLFLFFTIFKVYYSSPLVFGIDLISYRLKAKSDLAFLLVADGLRPDKFYPTFLDTFSKDSFVNLNLGYSHTRVPTESRPGHLALLGGFYEDVSAVTKGWKSNPIEFDSIFNHTCRGYAWGGPDVVPYFRPFHVMDTFSDFYYDDRIRIEAFPEFMLDMTDHNVTAVDQWTFNKFRDYFSVNSEEFLKANCPKSSQKEGKLIFLHLNAADQVGHNFKPESPEYVEVVNYLIKFLQDLKQFMAPFEKKYKISYIFTSDHGMTNWGSHGGGSDAETKTLLITWGHGFRVVDQEIHLEQADVCPLLAALIGCKIPTNSIGKLPIDLLDLNDEERFENLKVDTLQILNQVIFKHKETKVTHFFFKEFSEKTISEIIQDFSRITKATDQAKYELERLRNSLIRAKDYYHKYDYTYETFLVVSTYSTLIYNFAKNLASIPPSSESDKPYLINVIFSILLACNLMHSLWMTSKHFLMHFVLISVMYRTLMTKGLTLSSLVKIVMSNWPSYLIRTLIIEFAIFGFHMRYFLSIPPLIMAISTLITAKRSKTHINIPYLFSNILLCIFPQFPIVGQMKMKPFLVCISGFASIGPILVDKSLGRCKNLKKMRTTIIVLSAVSGLLLQFPDYHNRIIFSISWLLTLLPGPFYCWHLSRSHPDTNEIRKIYTYALIFSIPLHLMSLGYEGLFYWTLVFNLISWIKQEEERIPSKSRTLAGNFFAEEINESAHIAVYYTFYVIMAFFGTGNIASINGFDPVSTHCYIVTLIPAIMGALMIYKMICPIVIVSLVFSLRKNTFLTLQQRRSSQNGQTFKTLNTINMISFIISLLMSIHFFCWLLDEGSWADIGISISHYVISMAMGLLSTILLLLGDFLLAF